MRRLVVTVEDIACIGCNKTTPGDIRYITTNNSGRMSASIMPTEPWVRLSPQMNVPEQRTFAICPTCYQRGALYDTRSVDSYVEVES
jgi:hypothetical protein